MLNTRTRTIVIAAVTTFALGAPTPAVSKPIAPYPDETEGKACTTEGSLKTDRYGNRYKCVGGKWTLYTMPAYSPAMMQASR